MAIVRARVAAWCLPLAMLVWLGAVPDAVSEIVDELPIGLSDFPRKVRRPLPEVRPGQEVRVGPLKLHPSMRTAVQFDDNVRLRDIDKPADVAFIQRPALVGEVFFGPHRLEAGYGMEVVTYAKDSEENSVNHLANGELELNFGDFHINVSDAFEASQSRLADETSDRDRFRLNTVQATGRYDRPHWAMETGYIHNTIDHRTLAFDKKDYGEDVFSGLVGYKVLPKTLFLFETDAGLVNFDHNVSSADQSYWQVLSGIRGEVTSRLTATVKLGYQNRQMGDIGGQGPQKDFSGFVADNELEFAATPDDSFRAGYLRTVVPSTFSTNNWYTLDRIFASYTKHLSGRWRVTPKVAWQLNDYPENSTVNGITKQRADSFVVAGAEVRYLIQQWLSAGVAYNFRTRNSNIDTFDFSNNLVTTDITVAF